MNVLDALSEPFPQEVERQLKKGGTSLTYIPVSEVITRLNKVLGVDMWSYTIERCERDALDPDYIVAHVRLTATFVPTNDAPTITIVKDGVGGQKIKRTRNGDILDLGDEMKGAVSDALKKAAQHFGVGLYLARTEESLHLEALEDSADDPISSAHFQRLRDVLNAQSQQVIEDAKKYWATISNGASFENENINREKLAQMLEFVKAAQDSAGDADAG